MNSVFYFYYFIYNKYSVRLCFDDQNTYKYLILTVLENQLSKTSYLIFNPFLLNLFKLKIVTSVFYFSLFFILYIRYFL